MPSLLAVSGVGEKEVKPIRPPNQVDVTPHSARMPLDVQSGWGCVRIWVFVAFGAAVYAMHWLRDALAKPRA
jgi:hypothetical protein